jgi:hypothetical protein
MIISANKIDLGRSTKEREEWGDQDVGGWVILKYILERWDGVVWT